MTEQLSQFWSALSEAERPTLLPPVPSPERLAYRRSVKLVIQAGVHGPKVGLYHPGSHWVIDTAGCPVQSPAINKLLDELRLALQRPEAPSIYDERTGEGALRYAVIRESSRADSAELSELHLTLVATQDSAALRELIAALYHADPKLIGAALHLNPRPGNAIFDWSATPMMQQVAGASALLSHFPRPGGATLPLLASAESFSQVNPAAAALAYQAVVEALDPRPSERALDLYCGVGSIALSLSLAGCAEVIGLEESASSVADARHNASSLERPLRFIEGLTERELPALVSELIEGAPEQEPGAPRQVLVSLNPSRRGCQAEVIEQLARLRPRRIAYMSCHPRTFGRDLKRLMARGYFARSIQLFDLFPGTPHFELVCLLEPRVEP